MSASAALAQDDLRDTVYGKPKSSETKKAAPATNKKKTTRTPAPKTQPSVARRTPRPVADGYEVTFICRSPMVEVFVNDRSIGVSDENNQVSHRMAPGEYRVMAKTNRQIVFGTTNIKVDPSKTIFRLYDETPEKKTPKSDPVAEMSESELLDIVVQISDRVKKIVEDYARPETTDSITVEDWQLVFEAAQLGRLQGYTAVQIEAKRWFASGQIELAKKEYVNAFTAFNKSLEFMPGNPLPYYALGNTYLASGKYVDAVKLYQKALQLEPRLGMVHRRLGDALRLQGKEKEAIPAYRMAIQNGYKTLETRYWLGTLMLETKQIEDAIAELSIVAKEMPKAEVYLSIGEGYLKLKRGFSAIEAFLKATEADPNSAIAFYKLAEAYQGQREYPKAKEAYEKALALDPDGKVINRGEAQKKLRETTEKQQR